MNSTSESEPRPSFRWKPRVLTRRDAFSLDARLHASDLPPPVFGERVAVHVRLGQLQESRAENGVTGDEAGASEGLELPDLGALCPIGRVRLWRPREDALPTLGPEPRVDAEGLAFRGGLTDRAHELRRDVFRTVERARTGSVEDEQHVDVGGVRQFAPTEPAHPDHRERQLRLERLQRGLEGGVGEI